MSYIGSALFFPKDMLYSNLPITRKATSLMRKQWASMRRSIHECIIASSCHTIPEKKAMLHRLHYAIGKGELAFRRMDDTGRQDDWLPSLVYMTKRGKEHTGHKVTGGGIDAKIAIVFVTSHRDPDISGGVYILFQK
jgi:hypothetical protein